MIVETGHYALVLALALALINSVLPVWGSIVRDQRLMAVAPPVALVGFGLVAYYLKRHLQSAQVLLTDSGLR